MKDRIYEKIYEQIGNALPNLPLQNASLHEAQLIRAKNGVHVYRSRLDNQPVVIKYFVKDDDKREISNYRLLIELGIPTMHVIAYGISCIVLEDIDSSDSWRLGKEEDLQDEAIALKLAHGYFDFHEKGSLYDNLNKLYHETDCITVANLQHLCNKIPQGKETFDYITANLESLHKFISETEQTLNYNDFYWTNLLVAKDRSAAMPFDFNLLGAGYRYNDIRNVSLSLSQEAASVFRIEYDRLYEERYGFSYSRSNEEAREQQIDEVTSDLITLIVAFERKDFPSWADLAKNAVIDGSLLEAQWNYLSDTI